MALEDIDALDALGVLIDNKLNDEGLIVKAKTDVSGELTVYDADKPSKGKSFFMPDIGVSIYNREGKLLANYGGKPSFNFIKAGIMFAPLIVGGIILIKGLKGFTK